MSYQPPQTIEELMDLTYCKPSKDVNSYNKWCRNPQGDVAIDSLNIPEHDIKEFLSQLGTVEKIQECNQSTCDFIINKHNILFEVKSINTVYEDTNNSQVQKINLKDINKWVEKFNLAFNDIQKQLIQDKYESLFKIGVFWIDIIQQMSTNENSMVEIIKKTKFKDTKLDALLMRA